ncbi:glycoside hydrolase family 32 protein [Pricia sp.]|uniref:glycoside hydrolase family 32 protein n=1 Tax=Pricia sp. TaxID=2268138 RepID=UPI003594772C
MPFLFLAVVLVSCKNDKKIEATMASKTEQEKYTEPYRPQFHFSPESMWMNDPNGMVYTKGVYHLFYQYHPDSTVWGPMHWGHATSKDLLHWQHKPIALYPDEKGFIFSGSAVLDKQNSSGFGTDDNPPLVAIFTYHDAGRKASGDTNFETQGIAYSLDNGDSWTKYDGNSVVSDENSTDFRDPKVFWYEPDQKWIMSLVAGHHAQFYGSKNLKDWELLGEFGKDRGAHGGVWECPDLLPFKVEGTDKEKWVLLISINPGAPNGGSGTQYFIGDFDGKTFTTDQTEVRWIDWGTDNYAGVTFSNAPDDEMIFLGWMSNWLYANETPTESWRGTMTLPRKLTLEKEGKGYTLFNYPIEKVDGMISEGSVKDLNIAIGGEESISVDNLMRSEVRFVTSSKDFQLKFGNKVDEELVLTLKSDGNELTLDRSRSGKTDFQEDFGKTIQQMPIPDLPDGKYEVRILMDRSSIEIFLNKGQYAITAQVFPNENYNALNIVNTSDAKALEFKNFGIGSVKGVW